MAIELKREEIGDAYVVSIQGSVDIYSSPELRGALKAGLDKKAAPLVVDMGGVSFVDSSGLATLIEALQRVNGYDGRLVLCSLSENVLGVFQLANLDNIFTIADNRDAALGS